MPTFRICRDGAELPGEVRVEPFMHERKNLGTGLGQGNAIREVLARNEFPCLVLEEDAIWRADAVLPETDEPWLWVGLSKWHLVEGGRNDLMVPRGIPVNGTIELGRSLTTHGVVYLRREGALRMLEAVHRTAGTWAPIDVSVVRASAANGWRRPGLIDPWVYQNGVNAGATNVTAVCDWSVLLGGKG